MIKPLGQRVLLEKVEVEKTTVSGIVLPDSVKEEKNIGKVVALGTGKKLDDGSRVEFDVKPGDRVVFSPYSTTETKVDGNEYLIIEEKEILAIID
ncbi:co-chaperone GroES [Haloplasma contractile]|uniref:Co-chaperonin GroES n=1 Tax=Haloplasma contractile SSD-17B TaxID=1033810 RepID=U2DYR6_9MOLU|nr:co-chaperone GroES [Haloplasma contractile]ERJ13387.1 10 kDa chaperonin protein [Haloplasma contractile SSD-17B]